MLSAADLDRVLAEAGPALKGGSVHRIWRDGEDTYVFLVRFPDRAPPAERHGADRLALEVGVAPEEARLCVLPPEDVAADDPSKKKERKADSHFFLATLRKTLPHCKIESITRAPGDRIVLVDLVREEPSAESPPDEEAPSPALPRSAGEGERLRLAVELTGRATNLVLIDRGAFATPDLERDRIVQSWRPGRHGRELDPGKRYVLPPPRPPRADAPPDASVADDLFEPEIAPDPATLALSRAIAQRARETLALREAQDRRTALVRSAQNGIKRARGLVAKLEKERDEALAAEKLRQKGELLKANVAKIKKGMTSVKVVDFFDPAQAEVEIELDPLETPMDQARAYFKRAKKLDRGLVAIETRLGACDAEAEELEKLAKELEEVATDDTDALDKIEKGLRKLGAAPKEQAPPTPKKKQKDEPRGPRKFISRDGFEILVGRSNEENDRLTITIARGNDLFFHVRGFPGSHVIVRHQANKTVPLETLLDAGALAVHYSKVRGNARADVSYTPRKYVRKPRGAKPGLVEISNEKTIRPDGDPARLARLLATAGGRADDDDEEEDV